MTEEYQKLYHTYENGETVDPNLENILHKSLERDIWYHTHDGKNGSHFSDVTISGCLTSDDLIVEEKVGILEYVKHYDSGWLLFRTDDFEFVGGGNNQDYWTRTIEHDLDELPTFSYLYISEDGGINQKMTFSDFRKYKSGAGHLPKGAQIRTSSTNVELRVGESGFDCYGSMSTYATYYKIILIV